MAKRKTLYLILAVACFIGIILIFVIDGYMGLYDSLSMTSGELTQTISFEQWRDADTSYYSMYLHPSGTGTYSFSYELDNRRFGSCQDNIEVTAWKNQVKLRDILVTSADTGAFSKETIAWTIDPIDYIDPAATVQSQFTMVIKRGNIERRVIVSIPLDSEKILVPIPAE